MLNSISSDFISMSWIANRASCVALVTSAAVRLDMDTLENALDAMEQGSLDGIHQDYSNKVFDKDLKISNSQRPLIIHLDEDDAKKYPILKNFLKSNHDELGDKNCLIKSSLIDSLCIPFFFDVNEININTKYYFERLWSCAEKIDCERDSLSIDGSQFMKNRESIYLNIISHSNDSSLIRLATDKYFSENLNQLGLEVETMHSGSATSKIVNILTAPVNHGNLTSFSEILNYLTNHEKTDLIKDQLIPNNSNIFKNRYLLALSNESENKNLLNDLIESCGLSNSMSFLLSISSDLMSKSVSNSNIHGVFNGFQEQVKKFVDASGSIPIDNFKDLSDTAKSEYLRNFESELISSNHCHARLLKNLYLESNNSSSISMNIGIILLTSLNNNNRFKELLPTLDFIQNSGIISSSLDDAIRESDQMSVIEYISANSKYCNDEDLLFENLSGLILRDYEFDMSVFLSNIENVKPNLSERIVSLIRSIEAKSNAMDILEEISNRSSAKP